MLNSTQPLLDSAQIKQLIPIPNTLPKNLKKSVFWGEVPFFDQKPGPKISLFDSESNSGANFTDEINSRVVCDYGLFFAIDGKEGKDKKRQGQIYFFITISRFYRNSLTELFETSF